MEEICRNFAVRSRMGKVVPDARGGLLRVNSLLSSAYADEVGAGIQRYSQTAGSRRASEAHFASNWHSYFDIGRSGNLCGTRVPPGLQYVPDIFLVTSHVEAV